MAGSVNKVIIVGNLGKDPETRFTPTGKKVAHFSVAISQRWKTGGESKEYTEWVNIEAWGRLGEVCQQVAQRHGRTGAVLPFMLMRIMRTQTSEKSFTEFPRMKKENPSGDFWAPGYLIMGGTQPHPPQLVKDYIKQTRERQGYSQPRK